MRVIVYNLYTVSPFSQASCLFLANQLWRLEDAPYSQERGLERLRAMLNHQAPNFFIVSLCTCDNCRGLDMPDIIIDYNNGKAKTSSLEGQADILSRCPDGQKINPSGKTTYQKFLERHRLAED